MSTTSSTADLATRYQKLATEYAKLRAQLPLMREEVINQRKNNEELQGSCNSKDLELRKQEQEMESLSFRNNQLSKRVEHLQTRLDQMGYSPGGGSGGGKQKRGKKVDLENGVSPFNIAATDTNCILREELDHKLSENINLHKKIFELESSFENSVKDMKVDYHKVLEQNKDLTQEISSLQSEYSSAMQELKERNATLEEHLGTCQQDLSAALDELNKKRSHISDDTDTDSSRRSTLVRASCDVDKGNDDLLKLNVPKWDAAEQQCTKECFCLLKELISSASAHLYHFFTYCQQRAQLYPCDSSMEKITSTCTQLIQCLDGAITVKSFGETFDSFCDDIDFSFPPNLNDQPYKAILSSFDQLVNFANSAEPFICKSYSEECSVSWCSSKLEQDNHIFIDNLAKVISSISNIHVCLSFLEEPNLKPKMVPSRLESIAHAVEELHICVDSLSEAFQCKVASEHQLPTATKKLRTTNECILASLNSLAQDINKMNELFATSIEVLNAFLMHSLQRAPEIGAFAAVACSYMEELNKVLRQPQRISSSYSLSNVQNILSPSPVGQLPGEDSSQQTALTCKVAELEKEKEHWILEAQLLKMKLANNGHEAENDVGNGDGDSEENFSEGSKKSECPTLSFVQKHYEDKIAELVAQILDADSKAFYFSSECNSLINLLKSLSKQKEKLQSDLRDSSDRMIALKDDLESTRGGYESQMSTMSDHMADLNQKIAEQTDQIEMLKRTLNEKGHRKGIFK